MTVKIVTDSTANLPPQLAKELGITVVPEYVRFGDLPPIAVPLTELVLRAFWLQALVVCSPWRCAA
jgi:hypothetical protein